MSSGFVGRLAELGELSRCVEQVIAGRGQLVVISGERGIGKTRLCEELAYVAGGLGVSMAWAGCWESGGRAPFWPWRQLLDQMGVEVEVALAGEVAPDVARARWFAAVIDAVRSAAAVRPWLLVFDDVQWADAGTVGLLTHIGPVMRSVRALLVAIVRDGAAASGSLPPELVRGCRVMRLGGLHVGELGELVEGLTGSRPQPEVSRALHRTTAGNPLFAGELIRRLHREDRLEGFEGRDDLPVSPTVRAVLDEQLSDLSDRCRELLAIAAVVGPEFPLGLVADVACREPLEALVEIEEAVAGGVVVDVGLGRYAFTHPLLRSVVHDDIGVAPRVRLHQRIGDTLEAVAARGGEVDLAALSFHFFNAAPGGTAGKAVYYAELAARSAMTALGYENAVELYDLALAANELDPAASDRGALLLGAGEAKAASGDVVGARAAFLAAADHARRAGRRTQLAAAALGLAGSGFEVTLFDPDQIAVLEEALDALSHDEPGLRSRVSGRLSVALSLAGQEPRRALLAESAVRLAHDIADSGVLADALAARCDAGAGPADVAQRASDSAKIISIARARGDHGTEMLGRRLRLVAALEIGDVRIVDAEIHAFGQIADRLRQLQYRWYVPLWRAMRAAMRGHLAEQHALTLEAEELGRSAGSANSEVLVIAQRWFSWLETGDVETAVSQLDLAMPPGAYPELGVQTVPIFAVHRLLAGRPEEARAMLDSAADDLVAADRDSEWLTVLAQVADAVFRLGGHELVPWIYDALKPFGELWVVDGIGAYAHGPAHRHLGLLAALLGRTDDASMHFDAALAGNRRAGADLLVARTLFDRGLALAEPASLRAACDIYRDLGVQRRTEELEALLRPAAVVAPVEVAPPLPDNEFRPTGDVWTVSFGAHRCSVRDSKGIRDIARLMAQPGREIPALDLITAGGTRPARGDLGDTIDARARAAYKARLVELCSRVCGCQSGSIRSPHHACASSQSFITEIVAPGFLPPSQFLMCSSDRKRFIIPQVKTMSSHHRNAGTRQWNIKVSSSGSSLRTSIAIGAPQSAHEDSIRPSVCSAAHTPKASHAQFAYHHRLSANTRYAVGTAENGFAMRISRACDCSTNA